MEMTALFRTATGRSFLLFFIIGLSVVSVACSEQEKEKPAVVMDEQKMVEVMVDMHLTEAVLTRIRGAGKDVEEISDDYYENIFEKHNINKKIFDKSFSYYQRNLGDMEGIYEQVIVELNKMQREREMMRKNKQKEASEEESKSQEENTRKSETKKLDLRMDLKEDGKK
jgi:Skp family chaperone for outer membrane proteins